MLDHITVVIPTLNEREGIGKVIDEVLSLGIPRDRVVVIDGGSSDGTDEIARSKGIKVIRQEGRGKADALKTALKIIETPYALVMDGDYTYPAKHIPELVREAIERGLDEVIGARLEGKENIPVVNRFGNRLLNITFNLLFGARLRDVLSGMYLVRVRSLRDALFEVKGFSIESEIAAHILSTSGSIGEVPITYRRRVGSKKLRVADGLRIGIDMVALAWRYNPVFFISFLGSLLLIPGLIMGGWVGYEYIFMGVKHYVKGVLSVILAIMGVQSFILAIIALYLKRIELRFLKRIEMQRKELLKLLDKEG